MAQDDTNLRMQVHQHTFCYKCLIVKITKTIKNSAQENCKTEYMTNSSDKRSKINLPTPSVLLPGLPNHLAELCLSYVQPSLLYRVCTSWRRFIYSPSFPPFFSLYVLVSSPTEPSASLFCLDPYSSKWKPLPNPPSDQSMCLIRKHPSYISRTLPIQTITSSRRLVMIAGTAHKFLPGLSRPLVFDPLSSKWYFGPPFSAPRRWCVVGSINGAIYMGSGTGAQYNGEVARSLERWDMSKTDWEKRSPFKDGKFSREAIEAVGYRGKLCMVNINGKAVKEGTVYDIAMDQWEEMSPGMLAGWNGPGTVDGDDGVMYVLDQENGSLLRYDGDDDHWEEIIEHHDFLKGAQHISARCQKICAVSGDGLKIVMVDVLAMPVKIWTVNPPQGMEAISVHILPRMTLLNSE